MGTFRLLSNPRRSLQKLCSSETAERSVRFTMAERLSVVRRRISASLGFDDDDSSFSSGSPDGGRKSGLFKSTLRKRLKAAEEDAEYELFLNLWTQLRLMPPYSNRAHGQRLRRWSYFLMLLGLYEAMYVPLQLSFEEPRDPFGRFRLPALQSAVQCLIDICFIVDIAVRFRTMYVSRADEGNELITDRRKIAHRYLHGYFTIDLLSVVPIDVFASGTYNGVRVLPHAHTPQPFFSRATAAACITGLRLPRPIPPA